MIIVKIRNATCMYMFKSKTSVNVHCTRLSHVYNQAVELDSSLDIVSAQDFGGLSILDSHANIVVVLCIVAEI